MAWEDLEEDIAEEFSDNRRLGWEETGFRFFRRAVSRYLSPKSTRERCDEANARRRAARETAATLEFYSGKRLTRCAGPRCCNLLPIRAYGGGPRQRFCSYRCRKSVTWARLKRAQRARRNAHALLSGARIIHCTASECCNFLPIVRKLGQPRKFCSKECRDRAQSQRRRRSAPIERTCAAPGCSNRFKTANIRKETCSNACRQRAWYHRPA